MRKTCNSLLFSQSLLESQAKAYSDIFNRVVRINLKIPFAHDLQIENPMLGKKGQHMVQKRYSGLDCAVTMAVDIQLDLDIRLLSSFAQCLLFVRSSRDSSH